ncbi:uncharacterized protein ARMOST_22146 [Armillaria ostoyae]|uniref:Uncharacterized protein n=1 Tax=Armillaria ostoyae TaxID=47428 RepID=A0A284SC16_ARMOS|nr:uncharacterized protein ARMOST_22146 [Armillaria ostoyae]
MFCHLSKGSCKFFGAGLGFKHHLIRSGWLQYQRDKTRHHRWTRGLLESYFALCRHVIWPRVCMVGHCYGWVYEDGELHHFVRPTL